MNDKDILQRFIFENASIRGEIVRLEESYQVIMKQHQYPPAIKAILGEILVVASLLSASTKIKGRVTVQFQGKGTLKLLLAQSTHDLHIRGLAQWQGDLPADELMKQLKQGLLAITIDPEVGSGSRYQGVVAWQGDSLAHSIEGYFTHSEQLPTRLWLAVNQHRAAGFLIQVMPRESTRLGKNIEGQEDWEHISLLTKTLTANELLNLDNATILKRLYVEEDLRLFDASPVSFRCTCSDKRSENALLMLGKDEVEEELNEKQKVVVTCEFCNKEFMFDRVDVARIFKESDSDSSTQLH